MAYEKQTWNDGDTSTPLSAERLNHIEDGIAAKAEKGDKGDDGADGFPSESDWDTLKDRVQALEDQIEES